MDICPSKDELLALLAGSDEGSTGLRAHVDDCPDCRRSVARLLGALRLGAEYQAFAEPADRGDLLTEVDMSPQAVQRIFEAADEARRQSLPPPARCPSEDQLAKLLAEPEAVGPAVHGHVEQCSDCRGRVESLRGLLEHAADYDAFLCGGEEAPSDVHDRIFAAVSAKMQPPVPVCPSNEELIAVLAGNGQDASHRDHLDGCDSCREKAAKLLGAIHGWLEQQAFATGEITSKAEPIPADVAKRIYEHLLDRLPESGCLSWNELLAVLAGSAEDSASRTHLNHCAACQATAAKLLGAIRVWLEKRAFETGEIREQAEAIPEQACRRIFDGISTLPAPRRMFQRAAAFVWRQGKKPQMQAIAASLMIAVTGFLLFNEGGRGDPVSPEVDSAMEAAHSALNDGRFDDARSAAVNVMVLIDENRQLADRGDEVVALLAAIDDAEDTHRNVQEREKTRRDIDSAKEAGFSLAKSWLDSSAPVVDAATGTFHSLARFAQSEFSNRAKQLKASLAQAKPTLNVPANKLSEEELAVAWSTVFRPQSVGEGSFRITRYLDFLRPKRKANPQFAVHVPKGVQPNGQEPRDPARQLVENNDRDASRVKSWRQDGTASTDRLVKRHESTPRDVELTGVSPTGGYLGAGG